MRKRVIIKNKTFMWSKIKTLSVDEGYSKSKNSPYTCILGIYRQISAEVTVDARERVLHVAR